MAVMAMMANLNAVHFWESAAVLLDKKGICASEIIHEFILKGRSIVISITTFPALSDIFGYFALQQS